MKHDRAAALIDFRTTMDRGPSKREDESDREWEVRRLQYLLHRIDLYQRAGLLPYISNNDKWRLEDLRQKFVQQLTIARRELRCERGDY